MFRYWLHNGTVDDDQMFRSGVDRPAVPVFAGIEEESRAFEAYPVAFPTALPGQLNLLPLPQEPLFHA